MTQAIYENVHFHKWLDSNTININKNVAFEIWQEALMSVKFCCIINDSLEKELNGYIILEKKKIEELKYLIEHLKFKE